MSSNGLKEAPESLLSFKHIRSRVDSFLGNIDVLKDVSTKEHVLKKTITITNYSKAQLKDVEVLMDAQHPNLLHFYGMHQISDVEFDVYFEDVICTLEDEIRQRQKMDASYTNPEIFMILSQITSALAFLQERNVAHRKITTKAIFKVSENQYKIVHPFLIGDNISNRDIVREFSSSDVARFLTPETSAAQNSRGFTLYSPYKDDIYSLGVALLDCCALEISKEVFVARKMDLVKQDYSMAIYLILEKMLDIAENERMDSATLNQVTQDEVIQHRITEEGDYRESCGLYSPRLSSGTSINQIRRRSPSYQKSPLTNREQLFENPQRVKGDENYIEVSPSELDGRASIPRVSRVSPVSLVNKPAGDIGSPGRETIENRNQQNQDQEGRVQSNPKNNVRGSRWDNLPSSKNYLQYNTNIPVTPDVDGDIEDNKFSDFIKANPGSKSELPFYQTTIPYIPQSPFHKSGPMMHIPGPNSPANRAKVGPASQEFGHYAINRNAGDNEEEEILPEEPYSLAPEASSSANRDLGPSPLAEVLANTTMTAHLRTEQLPKEGHTSTVHEPLVNDGTEKEVVNRKGKGTADATPVNRNNNISMYTSYVSPRNGSQSYSDPFATQAQSHSINNITTQEIHPARSNQPQTSQNNIDQNIAQGDIPEQPLRRHYNKPQEKNASAPVTEDPTYIQEENADLSQKRESSPPRRMPVRMPYQDVREQTPNQEVQNKYIGSKTSLRSYTPTTKNQPQTEPTQTKYFVHQPQPYSQNNPLEPFNKDSTFSRLPYQTEDKKKQLQLIPELKPLNQEQKTTANLERFRQSDNQQCDTPNDKLENTTSSQYPLRQTEAGNVIFPSARLIPFREGQEAEVNPASYKTPPKRDLYLIEETEIKQPKRMNDNMLYQSTQAPESTADKTLYRPGEETSSKSTVFGSPIGPFLSNKLSMDPQSGKSFLVAANDFLINTYTPKKNGVALLKLTQDDLKKNTVPQVLKRSMGSFSNKGSPLKRMSERSGLPIRSSSIAFNRNDMKDTIENFAFEVERTSHKDLDTVNLRQSNYFVDKEEQDAVYEGEMINGRRHGRGKLFYKGGEHYEGEWKNGQMSGYGVFFDKNEKKCYEGHYEDGIMKGSGIFYNNQPIKVSGGLQFGLKAFDKTSDSWTKFEGEFKDNEWEGIGKLYLVNHDMYYGEFKRSRLHGYGCLYTNAGEVVSGIWENNHFIKSQI